MTAPLHGLRVIDCSHGSTGPRATGVLADYGADVVWVERPGGDPYRQHAPAAASVFNRNKRSIEVDLNEPVGRSALLEQIATADVFVESWRPGVADSFGLGWRDLRELNPKLVYCSISGFGAEGILRDVPGYEAIVHALVGTMAEQAGHRDPPIFQGLPFASIGAAYLAVIGVLAALYRRHDDGVGRRVETSLFDGALAYHSMLWGESDESVSGRPGTSTDLTARRPTTGTRIVTRSFVCADEQFIGIHTGAHGAFGRLMVALGLDDRIPPSESGMDIGQPLTADQQRVLESEIHGIFASQPRAFWVERLLAADVCAVEHLHPTQVFDEPQARHNDMIIEIDDPVLGRIEQVAQPAKLHPSTAPPPTPAPLSGADTAAILSRRPDRATVEGMRSSEADRRPLLDGLRVLDLGAFYAGPFSSRLLADLGADVIKIEPVRGDQLRGLERPFFSAQAGKRSVAADLKHPAMKPAVQELLQWADVVHHNLRPGAAERLGLDWDSAHQANDRLIYLYAPGWGASGPHQRRQSFAPMLSGYVGVTFEVAGRYNEPMPPVGNEDPGNGLVGAIGILLALLVRQATGRGSYIENPQLNATMNHMAHVVRTSDGQVIGAEALDTLQFGVSALERLYETADGWICLVATGAAQAAAVGKVVGVDIADDARFADFEPRRRHDDELADLLGAAMSSWCTADLVEALRSEGVAVVEPVGRNIHTLMNDPEQRRLRRVAEVTHPAKGRVRELDVLLRISDTSMPDHRLAPELGEHTAPILESLGYTLDLIRTLEEDGVIRASTGWDGRQRA